MTQPVTLVPFPKARVDARPVLAASIAVFRDDGHVLIATRTKPPASGVWSLPGGKVEPGETLEAAALRELMEEVGVSARIVGFNRHVEIIQREPAETGSQSGRVSHHFVVASFVGLLTGGEARPGPEAGDVAWVDPARLGGRATTRELGPVLRDALAIWRQAVGAGAGADQRS
jgi:8-oxo-dGTP pyrophosphatase MutT (NUDIX family)